MTAEDITAYLYDSSLTLPEQKPVTMVVEEILTLLASSEGVTYSRYFGDIRNQKLYAVSIYPEQSRKIPGRLQNRNILQTFLFENVDLLAEPRNCVGIWYDAEQDATYLDVTTILPDREEAVQLGKAYNQIGLLFTTA